jgi:hypothetical protein
MQNPTALCSCSKYATLSKHTNPFLYVIRIQEVFICVFSNMGGDGGDTLQDGILNVAVLYCINRAFYSSWNLFFFNSYDFLLNDRCSVTNL